MPDSLAIRRAKAAWAFRRSPQPPPALAKYSPLRAIGSLLHSFSKGGVRGVDAAIRVAVYDLQFSQPLQIALGNQVEAKVDLIPEHDESRSEEHTSELQSLMRISYAFFCLNNKRQQRTRNRQN